MAQPNRYDAPQNVANAIAHGRIVVCCAIAWGIGCSTLAMYFLPMYWLIGQDPARQMLKLAFAVALNVAAVIFGAAARQASPGDCPAAKWAMVFNVAQPIFVIVGGAILSTVFMLLLT